MYVLNCKNMYFLCLSNFYDDCTNFNWMYMERNRYVLG